jgi:cell division protein FtsQ
MKKWLKITFWSAFTIAVFILLSMTKTAQMDTELEVPEILIKVNGENVFLTKEDLLTRLKRAGLIYPGQKMENLKIANIEKFIAEMTEVKEVKVYSNLGGTWNIDVHIRKPIARIFNSFGEDFYLDEVGSTMAPSYLYTARVVIVTGYINDRKNSESVEKIINNDTLISIRNLDDIYRISSYVCNDAFLSAQIGQINLEKNGDFVLVPQVGGQKIIFGSARTDEDVAEKFKKLTVFYKEGLPFEGWDKYEVINLKYNRQIVCKKKKIISD